MSSLKHNEIFRFNAPSSNSGFTNLRLKSDSEIVKVTVTFGWHILVYNKRSLPMLIELFAAGIPSLAYFEYTLVVELKDQAAFVNISYDIIDMIVKDPYYVKYQYMYAINIKPQLSINGIVSKIIWPAPITAKSLQLSFVDYTFDFKWDESESAYVINFDENVNFFRIEKVIVNCDLTLEGELLIVANNTIKFAEGYIGVEYS